MIRITFKNVDQGDTILIEWQKEGVDKIAIIDCNNAFHKNPALDYIISKGYTRIEFLLLSHPHTDHFSGFTGLIRHCIDQNIPISYFLHTSTFNKNFWAMAIDNAEAKSESLKLFEIIREAKQKIGMDIHSIQGGNLNAPLQLGGYFFKILGPTSTELDKFVDTKLINVSEEEKGNSPSANWLSTLIKIYSDDKWFVLLTSDVYHDILFHYGLKKNNTDEFKGKLVLGQSPHHGSKLNHKNSFWRGLNKDERTPIVFSVGKNMYGHPSNETVEFFQKNKFKLYSTNPVGPLMLKINASGKIAIAHINTFGHKISKKNDDYEGDKIFEIDTNGNVTKI